MHSMQTTLNQKSLSVSMKSLQGFVFTRTDPGLPLIPLCKGGSAFVPMGMSAKVLETQLAPGISVAISAHLASSSHRTGLHPSLGPLTPSEGGRERSAMVLAPANLPQLSASLRYRGR